MRVWDVHECSGAKDAMSRDVGLVSGKFPLQTSSGVMPLKGLGEYDFVGKGCVFGCVVPI